MRILGIDPGYERVGIAVLEKKDGKESLLYSDCFKTSPSLEFPKRLELIGEEIKRVVKNHKPNLLSIETLLFNTNQKTAMKVAEARGVVIYESVCGGLKVCEYTPLQIKSAVAGYGRADKEQVKNMTKQLILIEKDVKYDDEMDAIAISLTCSASYRA